MRAAAIVSIVAAACGGGRKSPAQPVSNEASTPAAPSTFDARHAQLSTIADGVCACVDAECAMKAMEPMNTFPMGPADGETETQDQRNRLADQADRALGCIDRLTKAAGQP